MSPPDPHWTIDTLKEYIESRLNGIESEMQLTREADQKAIEKALTSAKEMAEKHNDLIHQMERKDASYLSIKDYEQRHEMLKERLSRTESFQGKLVGGGAVIAAVGLANFVKVWTG